MLPAVTALSFSGLSNALSDGLSEIRSDVRRIFRITQASLGVDSQLPAPSTPCQCEASNEAWAVSTRTQPSCFFFDLGAADGNSFLTFLGKSQQWNYNFKTDPFTKQQCTSYLVEANPKFAKSLTDKAAENAAAEKVKVFSKTAVYMCDKADVKFFIDPKGTQWGSSLDKTHPDVTDTGLEPESVSMVNLIRLLQENTIPEDTVVVKMDIEGAEWDILPCLAENPAVAKLIDHLYVENHCPSGRPGEGWCASKGQSGNTKATFDAALKTLREAGVEVPVYNSPML